MEPLLLRPTDVADLLGISRAVVYKLIKSGTIPSVLLEGLIRIPSDQLRDWVASLPTSAARPPAQARHPLGCE